MTGIDLSKIDVEEGS